MISWVLEIFYNLNSTKITMHVSLLKNFKSMCQEAGKETVTPSWWKCNWDSPLWMAIDKTNTIKSAKILLLRNSTLKLSCITSILLWHTGCKRSAWDLIRDWFNYRPATQWTLYNHWNHCGLVVYSDRKALLNTFVWNTAWTVNNLLPNCIEEKSIYTHTEAYKNKGMDWGCRSVVKCLPSGYEALGLIFRTTSKNK